MGWELEKVPLAMLLHPLPSLANHCADPILPLSSLGCLQQEADENVR